MKGRYHIVVQNNRVRYELDIKRNITIIRGDSATGKTTLIQMIESAFSLGESSGIDLICEKPCRTLSGRDWNIILPNIHEQIIFLDEENHFIKSQEFASAVKNSDNYYVIITREDLPNLAYSVTEIYGLHISGKYRNMNRFYNEMYHIYSINDMFKIDRPSTVVVEDSNSGYEFFHNVCLNSGIKCLSAKGKSNIKDVIDTLKEDVLAIADGAAIGSEMNELYQYMQHHVNIKLYLPESFEWLILKSGLIDGKTIQKILENPEDYIESEKYFSWERFFTELLVEYSKDSYLKYQKSKLNKIYLHEKSKRAILNVMQGIDLD